MKVLMVLAGRDFPPDIRVEKECRALIGGEHEVTVVCDRDGDRPLEGKWNGVDIVRIPGPAPATAPLVKACELVFHRSFRWEDRLRRLIRDRAIDLVHVHDLPMVRTALECGRAVGVPVVADLHENYPAMVQLPTGASSPIRKIRAHFLTLLHRLARWESFERNCVQDVDHVLVVADEAKERLGRIGVPDERVTVIRNTVDVERMDSIPLRSDILDSYNDDFVISYIGGFTGAHRGLESVVQAMPIVLAECPQARLLLVGDGSMEDRLRQSARSLGIETRVTFVGWQPFEAVPSFIRRSQVCLVPHASFEHTETTMPHKLFHYMCLGKPVVVSSCRPLRRVVEDTGAGLVFDAGDEESLARSLITLCDSDLRERLGKAGRRAAQRSYNWSEDASTLLAVYDRFAEN